MSQDQTSTTTRSFTVPTALIWYLKFLRRFSPKTFKKNLLAIFFRPIPFPRPKREDAFYDEAEKTIFEVPSDTSDNLKAIAHIKGDLSNPKVILIHGWSGRGTQFYAMVPQLVEMGYCCICLTAPAHGEFKGKYTHMLQFADTILEAEKKWGPIDTVIGHSIGGLACMNAIRKGMDTKGLVVLGSPSKIESVVEDFVSNLRFSEEEVNLLIDVLKEQFTEDFPNFNAFKIAQTLEIPGLVVHDENDLDVAIEEAKLTHENWKNSEFLETAGLGHRRILSDQEVINKVLNFVETTTKPVTEG